MIIWWCSCSCGGVHDNVVVFMIIWWYLSQLRIFVTANQSFVMSAKKREYRDENARFRFVSLQKASTEVPQYVICYKTLSNDGMRSRDGTKLLPQKSAFVGLSGWGVQPTDRAPAMLSLQSGFITRVKERSPYADGTPCILHREALASRTLPGEMREVLNLAIKVVNYIKTGALNSRLFNGFWPSGFAFPHDCTMAFVRKHILNCFMNCETKQLHFQIRSRKEISMTSSGLKNFSCPYLNWWTSFKH